MSEAKKSEVAGSSINSRSVRKSGHPSRFMACVEPLRNYGVYKDLLDLLPSLPKGWTTEELEVFINCFSQTLKENTPVDDEVWREISKKAAKISSKPALFTVNNCIRVAESIKSYVTQKGRRDDESDDAGGFCEEVKHLLVYLPSPDPKPVDRSPIRSSKKKGIPMKSELGNRVGYSSVSEAGKKLDIDDLILSLVIQNVDSFRPTANLSAVWAEISAQIRGLPGMSSFDVRNHFENIKKNIIDEANLEKDPQVRNDKFLFLCKDYLRIFDYIPPRTVRKSEFLLSSANDNYYNETEKEIENSRKRNLSQSSVEEKIGSVHLESGDLTEKMALRSGRSPKKPKTFDVRRSREIVTSLQPATNKEPSDCSTEPEQPNCLSTTDEKREVNFEPVNLTVKTIPKRSRQPKKQKIFEVGVGKLLEVDLNGLSNISLQPSSIKEPNEWTTAPEKRNCASKGRVEVLRNQAESKGIVTDTEICLEAIKMAYEVPPRRGRPPKKQKIFDDGRASVEMIGLSATSLLPTAFKGPKAQDAQNSAFAAYVEALEGLRTRIPSCRDAKNRMEAVEMRFNSQNVIEAAASCLGTNVEVVRHPNIFNDFCVKSKMLAQYCQGTVNSPEHGDNTTHLLPSRNVKYNVIPSERTYTEEETYSNKKKRSLEDKNSTKTHLITSPENMSVFALNETLAPQYLYNTNSCTKTDSAGASIRTRRRCMEYVVPSAKNKAMNRGMNLVNFFNFQKEDQMGSKECGFEQKSTRNLPFWEAKSNALPPKRALDDNVVIVQTDVSNIKHAIHNKNSIITVGSESGAQEANTSVLSSRSPRRAMSRHDKTGNTKNLPLSHGVDQGRIFVKPPPKPEVLGSGKMDVEEVTSHNTCNDEVGSVSRRIPLKRRKMASQPDNSSLVVKLKTHPAMFGLSQNEMLITSSEVESQKAVTPHPPEPLTPSNSSAKMYDTAHPETIDAPSHPNGKPRTLNWILDHSASSFGTEVSIRKLRPRESRSNDVTSNNKMTSPTHFSLTSDNTEVDIEVIAVGRRMNKLEEYSLEIASNSLVTPPPRAAKIKALTSSLRTDSQKVRPQDKGRLESEQCTLNDAKFISNHRETSNMNTSSTRSSANQKSDLPTSTETKSSEPISNLGKHSIQNIISPKQPAHKVLINSENNHKENGPDARSNAGDETTKKRRKGSLNEEFPTENLESMSEKCENNLIESSKTQCQEVVSLSPFVDQLLYNAETDSESNFSRSNSELCIDKAVSTTPERKKKKSLEEISNDLLKKSSSRLLSSRNVQSKVNTSSAEPTNQNNVVPDNSSDFHVGRLAQNNNPESADIFLGITALSAVDDIKTSIRKDKNSLEDTSYDILAVKSNSRVLPPREAKNKVLTSKTESTEQNKVVPMVPNKSSEDTRATSKDIVVEVAAITPKDDLGTSVRKTKKGVEQILNDIEVKSNSRVLPLREAKNKLVTSSTESTEQIKVVPIVPNKRSENSRTPKDIYVEVAADDLATSVGENVELNSNDIAEKSSYRTLPPRNARNKVLTSSTEPRNHINIKTVPVVPENRACSKDILIEKAAITVRDDLETLVGKSTNNLGHTSDDIEVKSSSRILPSRNAKNKVLKSNTESRNQNSTVSVLSDESSENSSAHTEEFVEVAAFATTDDLETSVRKSTNNLEQNSNDIEMKNSSRVLLPRNAKNKVLTSTASTEQNNIVPAVPEKSSENTRAPTKDIFIEVAAVTMKDNFGTSVGRNEKLVELSSNDIQVKSFSRVLPPTEAKNKVLTSSIESRNQNSTAPVVLDKSSENTSAHTEDLTVEVAAIVATDDFETSVRRSTKHLEQTSNDIEGKSSSRILPPRNAKNKVLTSTASTDQKIVSALPEKSSKNTRVPAKDIFIEVPAITTKDDFETLVGRNKESVEQSSNNIEAKIKSRVLPSREAKNKVLPSNTESNQKNIVPVVPNKNSENTKKTVIEVAAIAAKDESETSEGENNKVVEQSSSDIEVKINSRRLPPRNAKNKVLTSSTESLNQNGTVPVVPGQNSVNMSAHTQGIVEVAAINAKDDFETSVGRKKENVEQSSSDIEVKRITRVFPPRNAKNKMPVVLDKSSENTRLPKDILLDVAPFIVENNLETSVGKNKKGFEQISNNTEVKSSFRVLHPREAKNNVHVTSSTESTTQNDPARSSEFRVESVTQQSTREPSRDTSVEVATAKDVPAGKRKKGLELTTNDIEVKSISRMLPPRDAKNNRDRSRKKSTVQSKIVVTDNSCVFSVSKQNTMAPINEILNGTNARSIVESNIEISKCNVEGKLTSGKISNSNQMPDKKVINHLTVPTATCTSIEEGKCQAEAKLNSGKVQTRSFLNEIEKMVLSTHSDDTPTSVNNRSEDSLSSSVLPSNETENKLRPLSSEAKRKNVDSSEETHIESIVQEKTSDSVFKVPGPFYKVLKSRKCTSRVVPTSEAKNRMLPGRKCTSRVLPTLETKSKNAKAVIQKDIPTTEEEPHSLQEKSFLSTSNKNPDVDRIPNKEACLKPVLHERLTTVKKPTRSIATRKVVYNPSNNLITNSDNIVASCTRKGNIVEDTQHHVAVKTKLCFPRKYLKKSQLLKRSEKITSEVDIKENKCNLTENTDFLVGKVDSSEEATTQLLNSVGDNQGSCSDEASQKPKLRERPPKKNIIARKPSKSTNDHILKRYLITMFPDGIVKYPVVELVDLKYSHKLKSDHDVNNFVVNIKESKSYDIVEIAGRTRNLRPREIMKNRQCSLKTLRVSPSVIHKKIEGRTKGTATKLKCNYTDNLPYIASSVQENKTEVSLPSQKNEQLNEIEMKSQEKLVEPLRDSHDGTVLTSSNEKRLGPSSVKDLHTKSVQSTTDRVVLPESSIQRPSPKTSNNNILRSFSNSDVQNFPLNHEKISHTGVLDPRNQQFKGSQTATTKKEEGCGATFSEYSSTCSQTTGLAQAEPRFERLYQDQLGDQRKTTSVVGVPEMLRPEVVSGISRAQATSSMQRGPTPGVSEMSRAQFGDQASNSNMGQPPMMGPGQRGLGDPQIFGLIQELRQGRGGLSGVGGFRETLPGGSAQMAGPSQGGPFFGFPPRAGPSSGSDMNRFLNRGLHEPVNMPNNQYDLHHMRLPPIWLQHILKDYEKSENWKLRHIVSTSNELLNLEVRRNLALDKILEFVTRRHE